MSWQMTNQAESFWISNGTSSRACRATRRAISMISASSLAGGYGSNSFNTSQRLPASQTSYQLSLQQRITSNFLSPLPKGWLQAYRYHNKPFSRGLCISPQDRVSRGEAVLAQPLQCWDQQAYTASLVTFILCLWVFSYYIWSFFCLVLLKLLFMVLSGVLDLRINW